MKTWKSQLENSIDVNTMLFKYEQQLGVLTKIRTDLEAKNKTLHKCAYSAYNSLANIREILVKEGTTLFDVNTLVETLMTQMEEILSEGTREQPALENNIDGAGIVTK